MIETPVPMDVADVLDQIKVQTGATDAQVVAKPTDWVWQVLTATPDGPRTHRMTSYLVDVEGPQIRILGF